MLKMSNLAAGAALTALCFTASPASAQEARAPVGVGVTAGSLGIGPELSYAPSDQIAIRANLTLFSYSRDYNSDDVEYSGKASLGSGGLMVDYRPGGGGFRLSAGARINKNKARVTATPSSNVSINGHNYTAAQVGTLTGEADFKTFSPQATIGYAGNLRPGLKFGLELGALFQGSAKVADFKASGGQVAAADLEAERQSVQDDVDKFKVYPILQFALSYRF